MALIGTFNALYVKKNSHLFQPYSKNYFCCPISYYKELNIQWLKYKYIINM